MSNNVNTRLGRAAYYLAYTLKQRWPKIQWGEFAFIENGFTCDFEIGQNTVSEDTFAELEEAISELASQNPNIQSEELSPEQWQRWFQGQNQKYLAELYKSNQNKFRYLLSLSGECQWPMSELMDFEQPADFVCKLTAVGGVYWQGDLKQAQLQRLTVVVFANQKELDAYLQAQAEKSRLDHRQIGRDQEIFMFSDLVGKGLPLFLEAGATIKRELENFVIEEELKRGYAHVSTPELAQLSLYEKSGHYPYYKDSMYTPIDIEDKQFMLRPMTCPHHFQIYQRRPHSYKELPVRLAELARLYRYEQSGELMGLLRVLSFTLSDAHIICRPDQVKSELNDVLQLIEDFNQTLGLKKYEQYFYRLSLGNRQDEKKYFKDDAAWERAEDELRQVLKERGEKFQEVEDEAAFYGPKIDIQMLNNNGQEETAFTVQYDFVMPKRFPLLYVDENSQSQETVVIHRSSVGAIERIMAFLIEFYGGKFPVWLAPCQLKILTVSQQPAISDLAQKLKRQFLAAGIRVKVDQSSKTVGKKIRQSQIEKIPYTLVLGSRELEKQTFQINERDDLATIFAQDLHPASAVAEKIGKVIAQRL